MAYQLTEKRREAARANLKKAWAAHRARRAARPERPPHLKHAFFARDLRQSVILLGEDVEEYDAHLARFLNALAPASDRERRIVVRLAESTWRLLRGYQARAHAQARKLRRLLDIAVPLTLKETRGLAFCVVENFENDRYLLDRLKFWREQLVWLFGRFFAARTGSDQGFRLESAAKSKRWDHWADFYDRLEAGEFRF